MYTCTYVTYISCLHTHAQTRTYEHARAHTHTLSHTLAHTHTHRLDDYYKKKYVVFYILICSLCGSLTVMCVKGVSTALILTISGTHTLPPPHARTHTHLCVLFALL